MTALEDAQIILDAQQDYTSRIIVLILLLLFHIYLYVYSNKWSETEDWQRFRNWIVNIYSFAILLVGVLIIPLFLSKGYTLELMINNIINFYKIGFSISFIVIIIWFKDKMFDMFTKLGIRFNPRKNYIFSKRKRGKN